MGTWAPRVGVESKGHGLKVEFRGPGLQAQRLKHVYGWPLSLSRHSSSSTCTVRGPR